MDFALEEALNFPISFIWQDKIDKLYRFNKINKFRKKRNINIKLYWERQW